MIQLGQGHTIRACASASVGEGKVVNFVQERGSPSPVNLSESL